MNGLTAGLRVQHEHIDGLVAQTDLEPGDEFERLAFAFGHWRFGDDEQVDIASPCLRVGALAEQQNLDFGTEDLGHGLPDDLFGGIRQAHLGLA